MQKFTYAFRFSTKIYDVISIGPYANKAAMEVAKISSYEPSILGVEEENYCIQASALPYSDPQIKINQTISAIGDLERGVGVDAILPNDNQILLKNGKSYRYKHLIYSGSFLDWKDTNAYPGLDQVLEKDYNFIYGDKSYQSYDEILERILGTVVFIIPKGRHFGSENYLMMLLQAKMKRRVLNKYPGEKPGRVIILNQGSSLIQNNKAHNELLEEMLKSQGILHLKNQRLKFDYDQKKVNLKTTKQTIKFDALFHYLPMKVPQVLPFDPFKTNPKTLNHSIYQNISILANVFPTTFSLSAMEQMSKVIARNIAYSLMGVRKQCIYQGETQTQIWKNQVELMNISTNYNTQRIQNISGKTELSRLALGRICKYGQKSKIQRIINGGINFPIFGQNLQEINTNKSYLPTIYHKNA